MNNPVILKGNRYGLVLILNSKCTLGEIICDLENKLSRNLNLFKNQAISITIEGKVLTNDEIDILIQCLKKNGIDVIYIYDRNLILKNYTNTQSNTSLNMFYKGNLKNGQVLESKESIIILGDIDVGASVFSEGNIIIIGKLLGEAISGTKGKYNTFVAVYEDMGGLRYV